MRHRHHPGCLPSHQHFCCPQHAMLILGARMAIGADEPVIEGPQPSFREGPDPNLTAFASGDDSNTRDLFDVAAKGQWVVVQGATVLPMAGAAALPNHDVLIQDGMIKSVQPSGAALPDGAIVVDGAGRFLIPGLSNMHNHPPLGHVSGMFAGMVGEGVTGADITLPYDMIMFQHIAAGVTRIHVMAGSPEDLANRENIRKGRYRGPHMKIASPVIDSPAAIWSSAITWYANDEQGGRTAAHKIREYGYDNAKPYTMLGREAYDGLIDECVKLGVPIMGHIPASVHPDDALRAGQTGVAHCFEFFYHYEPGKKFDPQAVAKRARLAKEVGATLQTTLAISYVYEYDCGLIPASAINFSATMDPVIRMVMREESAFIQGWRQNPVLMAAGEDMFQNCIQVCKALHAEGVRMIPGTDMSASAITGDTSLHHELRVLVESGVMTPAEVLKAGTIGSADYHGEAAVAGTIETGRRSDLVLLDADPTQDINNTTRIDTVILGDAILRREARERGLARIKARYDAMPVPAA
jgi:hypothetical protein